MRLFRIERKKYLKSALSGTGASLSKGFRWNSIHTRLVYTADRRALAILEVSVHLDLSEDLPNDRFYVELDVPEDIPVLEVHIGDLPENWDSFPPNIFTQTIGDEFVRDNMACILKVPSSIVPMEHNYLLNPAHPDMKSIRMIGQSLVKFDQRIKQR